MVVAGGRSWVGAGEKALEKEKKKFKDNPYEWNKEELKIGGNYKTSNPEMRTKFLKVLWKGVEREFGVDEVPVPTGQIKPMDSRPQDEQLLEQLEVAQADKAKEKTTKEEFAKSIAQWT